MIPAKVANAARAISLICILVILYLGIAGRPIGLIGIFAAVVILLQLSWELLSAARLPGLLVPPAAIASCAPDAPNQPTDVDPLTGLCNRRALEVIGRSMFEEALSQQRPVSVLMMDLDHFKKTNDLYGHPAGDVVLREFAEVLRGKVREIDFVGRYGGEEFIMVLPGAPLAPAARLAERIRSITEEHEFPHSSGRLPVTVSIGVATAYPEERTTLERLIEASDRNLYRAKRAGRNRVMAGAPAKDDDE